MSQMIQKLSDQDKMIHLVSTGDLSKLSSDERLAYYKHQCDRAGLDPLSVPFEWLNLKGKLVLYAKKGATDQLAATHKLKVTIVSEREYNGVYIVHCRAEAPDGRVKDDLGAVPIEGLKGEALCNAMMKASTKGGRRCVLGITGMGMLDETEVETIPEAQPVKPSEAAANIAAAARVLEAVVEGEGATSSAHAGQTTPPPSLPIDPSKEAAEKRQLALKARLDKLKQHWGPEFSKKLEEVLGYRPKKLSALTTVEVEKLEYEADESDIAF